MGGVYEQRSRLTIVDLIMEDSVGLSEIASGSKITLQEADICV